jgi:hypothetical protein
MKFDVKANDKTKKSQDNAEPKNNITTKITKNTKNDISQSTA